MRTMDKPNTIPFMIDFRLFSLPFIKKETVIGIIGNTQGVRIPSKPAKKDSIKNPHIYLPAGSSFAPKETTVGRLI